MDQKKSLNTFFTFEFQCQVVLRSPLDNLGRLTEKVQNVKNFIFQFFAFARIFMEDLTKKPAYKTAWKTWNHHKVMALSWRARLHA